MSKVFYLFPIFAFAFFAIVAISFNSKHALKYYDKKDGEITHIAIRKNIDKSNY